MPEIMSEIYNTSITGINIIALIYKFYKSGGNQNMGNLSICGTECSACHFYGENCTGCNECKGKVFYLPDETTCAIYNCTVNEKGLADCGKCGKMPCDIWKQTKDPSFSDEEFEENTRQRIQALKSIQ